MHHHSPSLKLPARGASPRVLLVSGTHPDLGHHPVAGGLHGYDLETVLRRRYRQDHRAHREDCNRCRNPDDSHQPHPLPSTSRINPGTNASTEEHYNDRRCRDLDLSERPHRMAGRERSGPAILATKPAGFAADRSFAAAALHGCFSTR
jgi:hypothetical protein